MTEIRGLSGQSAGGPVPGGTVVSEIRGLSGKPVADLTLEAVRAGEVSVAHLRIHPETLERQVF